MDERHNTGTNGKRRKAAVRLANRRNPRASFCRTAVRTSYCLKSYTLAKDELVSIVSDQVAPPVLIG